MVIKSEMNNEIKEWNSQVADEFGMFRVHGSGIRSLYAGNVGRLTYITLFGTVPTTKRAASL